MEYTRYGNFDADGSVTLGQLGPMNTKGAFNTLYGKGDFSNGTLKIQASPDGNPDNAVDVEDANLTADGAINFQARGKMFYVVLTGSSAPDVDWWVL